jgi:hypothetical protein
VYLGSKSNCDDNNNNNIIKSDSKEVRWEDVGWIHLAQDTDQWQFLVNLVMNLQVPLKAENFFTS